MTKGYWLVEPEELDGIIGVMEHDKLAVMILTWLIPHIQAELEELQGFEIEVINVVREFFPKKDIGYPALGLHHPEMTSKYDHFTLTKLVGDKADELLKSMPISVFIDFMASSELDWGEVMEKWKTS